MQRKIFFLNTTELHSIIQSIREFQKLYKIYEKEYFGIGFSEDFLSEQKLLLAVVKIKFYNSDIAQNEAISIIDKELKFLNFALSSNAHIQKFAYLTTTDFSNLGWKRSAKEDGDFINEFEKKNITNNPYNFLRNNRIPKACANHVLAFEPMFVEAFTTNQPEDYWRYLENLVPIKNKTKQVIEVVSTLLLIKSEKHNNQAIDNYIENTIIHSSYKVMNIEREKYLEYLGCINKNTSLDNSKINTEIQHPFMNYLLEKRIKNLTKPELLKLKVFYSRILWEVQAQRNAIIHSGFGNEISLISLYNTLPRLVTRFRWVLFEGMERHRPDSFELLIEELRAEAIALL